VQRHRQQPHGVRTRVSTFGGLFAPPSAGLRKDSEAVVTWTFSLTLGNRQ